MTKLKTFAQFLNENDSGEAEKLHSALKKAVSEYTKTYGEGELTLSDAYGYLFNSDVEYDDDNQYTISALTVQDLEDFEYESDYTDEDIDEMGADMVSIISRVANSEGFTIKDKDTFGVNLSKKDIRVFISLTD